MTQGIPIVSDKPVQLKPNLNGEWLVVSVGELEPDGTRPVWLQDIRNSWCRIGDRYYGKRPGICPCCGHRIPEEYNGR